MPGGLAGLLGGVALTESFDVDDSGTVGGGGRGGKAEDLVEGTGLGASACLR